MGDPLPILHHSSHGNNKGLRCGAVSCRMPSLHKQEVLYPQEILFIIVQEEVSGEVLSWLLHLIRPEHLAL